MAPLRVCFIMCLLWPAWAVITNSTDELLDVRIIRPEDNAGDTKGSSDKCLVQLHSSLEKLRRRQTSSRMSSIIDLSGYALHQSLRHAPVDMYVTDIKVKAPTLGSWVQVQRCQFSRNAEMSTHLLFNDLIVSGVVRLLPGEAPFNNPTSPPQELCTMSLRLRRAGLDLRASPTNSFPKTEERGRGIQVRTESNFVDPHFLSVHAYGCRLDHWARDDGSLHYDRYPEQAEVGDSRRQSRSESDESPSIRIISLGEAPELDSGADDHDLYRQRILGQTFTSEKVAALINMKKQIAQQVNAIYQVHGPFSQQSTTPKTLFTPHNQPPKAPILSASGITELDDSLRPLRPVPQKPFPSLVSNAPTNPLPNAPLFTSPSSLQDVSSEMEDVFLRGTKALLAKYLEKQLEVPIKEALMTKIGYTVSYG